MRKKSKTGTGDIEIMSDFSSVPLDQVMQRLGTADDGLSETEAARRKELRREGETRSWLPDNVKLLLRQFSSPFIILLAVAAILSAALGQASDAFIILFILFLTGLMGFWQEWNAGRAFAKLSKIIETKHSVLRDGKTSDCAAREIVAGDMVLLDAGDVIVGDCRIVQSEGLQVNEGSLTGESYPVEKSEGTTSPGCAMPDKFNMVWQGTSVISGTARVVVVRTGRETVFGKMAHNLKQNPETAFERGARRFGFFLLRITIVLSLLVLIVSIYFQRPIFDSLLFSLALAVGMAPELLPAIMTFTMASGAGRMMKKKVIVKKLSSIFNFGEVTVLCTDKTGTITEGDVKVNRFINATGEESEQVKKYAVINSSLQSGFVNPIDQAIRCFAMPDDFLKINELPYDFTRRRVSVATLHAGERMVVTKGALEQILEVCNQWVKGDGQAVELNMEDRAQLHERFEQYSKEGFRVLGVATRTLSGAVMNREDEKDMTFQGYVLLEDPLKSDAQASVGRLKSLGIEVRIITGDNRFVAMHAAREIGIENPVLLTGTEIDRLSSETLVARVRQADIFAEAEPQQKERIVRALQKGGHTVAYIGDGINDVGAIHAADTGISTNNAADVAKDAADFVLLDKDLSVLADGVEEGRKSFANSMKYIFITTGATFGNMLSVAFASVYLPFLPMLPKQILLTNLLTDFPFLTIAGDNVDRDRLRRPGKWDLKLTRKFMLVFGLHSTFFDVAIFFCFYHFFKLTGSSFQTVWFIESIITELVIVFIVRTRKPFLQSRPGRLLFVSSLFTLLLTICLPVSPFAPELSLVPIPIIQGIVVAGVLLLYTVTADLLKLLFFRWSGDAN